MLTSMFISPKLSSYSNNNRHMLLHAAEQLRKAAMVTPQQPIPKYAQAAHLVDATRLLLGHFDGYMSSVPKMRQVSFGYCVLCIL